MVTADIKWRTRIRIVLVGTTHPGNIGAAARAMKTMGLERLYLVSPERFPCAEATARAAGADDLLQAAVCCDNLAEALADCAWAVGTSARSRHIAWRTLDPESCAREAIAGTTEGEVALVFGRERAGLSNAELDLCQAVVHIPTNLDFSSLNLASAVQIMTYELSRVGTETLPAAPARDPVASVEDMERFYVHLEEALLAIGYLNPQAPKRLMRRMRRLYGRARPLESELSILRGILTDTLRKASR